MAGKVSRGKSVHTASFATVFSFLRQPLWGSLVISSARYSATVFSFLPTTSVGFSGHIDADNLREFQCVPSLPSPLSTSLAAARPEPPCLESAAAAS